MIECNKYLDYIGLSSIIKKRDWLSWKIPRSSSIMIAIIFLAKFFPSFQATHALSSCTLCTCMHEHTQHTHTHTCEHLCTSTQTHAHTPLTCFVYSQLYHIYWLIEEREREHIFRLKLKCLQSMYTKSNMPRIINICPQVMFMKSISIHKIVKMVLQSNYIKCKSLKEDAKKWLNWSCQIYQDSLCWKHDFEFISTCFFTWMCFCLDNKKLWSCYVYEINFCK